MHQPAAPNPRAPQAEHQNGAKGEAHHPGLKYIPAIDGLRAVAVLLVILFHAKLAFPGGYVGVDVFFVISGYLITSIILRDLARKQFSLADFWERRIRRIVPALSVVVLLTAAAGYFLFLPSQVQFLGEALIAQALMVSNFFFLVKGSYFDPVLEHSPLLHTWSLAVEEQFYVIFPIALWVLYLLVPKRASRAARWLIVMTCLVGAAGAIWLIQMGAMRIGFYLLPARAWELLCGSVVAVLPASFLPRSSAMRSALILLGLSGILLPALLYDAETAFPGLTAVPPCVGTALIIMGLIGAPLEQKLGWAEKALSCRPLVFVGLISYSLYLWHMPVQIYFHEVVYERSLFWWEKMVMVGTACLLAVLSWRFVETPFRKKTVLSKRWHAFGFAVVTLAIAVGCGWLFTRSDGFLSGTERPELTKYQELLSEEPVFKGVSIEHAREGAFHPVGETNSNSIDLFMWGDSHMMHLVPAMEPILIKHHLRAMVACYSDTPTVSDVMAFRRYGLNELTPEYTEHVLSFIQAHQIRHVFIAMAWHSYFSDNSPEVFLASFRRTLERLEEMGCEVTVFLSPPAQEVHVPMFLLKQAVLWRKPPFPYLSKEQHELALKELYQFAAQTPSVRWVDLASPLWNPVLERYEHTLDDVPVYLDKHHLSFKGATRIYTPYLEKEMAPLWWTLKKRRDQHDPAIQTGSD